jgi:HlyD family secretion protein
MNRRRIIVIAAVLVVLAAGGMYAWRKHAASDPTAAFWLSGNVDVHQVELAFRVSGRIAQLKVDEGDVVKEGESIAELDRVPFENDFAVAQAGVAQASAVVRQREADLLNARVTLERLQELVAKSLVNQQQVDDAQARVRVAEAAQASAREQLNLVTRGSRKEDIEAQTAALAASQARLEQAKTALQDTTLVAPSGGIVAVRARELGAIVQAGQTVYTLALTDPVWIRAYVPQPRLGRIKPGMHVKLEIDSMPGKQYDGTVGFISPEAEFTPKNVQTEQLRDDLVYRIRVIARDPDNVFRQGMPVTVRVPAADAAANSEPGRKST